MTLRRPKNGVSSPACRPSLKTWSKVIKELGVFSSISPQTAVPGYKQVIS